VASHLQCNDRPKLLRLQGTECQRFVRQVIQQYNRQGEAAVSRPGKGGRRNCYLSWEQEQRLIESFKKKRVSILLPPKKSSLPTSRKLDIKYIKLQSTDY